MLIKEIGIRGYKSFGNNEQILKLNIDKGELVLLVGSNGNGKCVDGKTLIDLEINDLFITDELFNFLDKTEKGKRIFLYIKENKPLLYEKIKRYNKDK
jgi:ABC-type dipeptide/oligopeptide/nickel transport system ATPase component